VTRPAFTAILRRMRFCILTLAAALSACTSSPTTVTEPPGGDSPGGGGGGDRTGGPSSRYRQLTFTYEQVNADVSARSAGFQGKLLRAPDGTLYYGFLKYAGTNTAGCDIAVFGGGPTPSTNYEFRVGIRPAGSSTWTVETVPLTDVGPPNYVMSLFGVDGVVDLVGVPTFTVAAGAAGLFTCGSSDLVLATRNGANNWDVRTAVTMSSECCAVPECPDPACTSGRDVGPWAAAALDENGDLAVQYTDWHNFVDEDGQTYQGLEFYRENGGVSGILPWSGMGNYGALVYSGSIAVSAYTRFNGTDLIVSRRVGTGSSVNDWRSIGLREDVEVGERISMAVAPDGRVGIAYAEVTEPFNQAIVNDIIYFESIGDLGDATAPEDPQPILWSDGEQVTSALLHLRMPSLAFDSASRPVISYQSCGGNETCQPANDGLRLAWRNEQGTWESIEVIANNSSPDGSYSSLVLDPITDVPTIAYQDRGLGAAIVAVGHFPEGN
jgi:hypothetical protein